MKQLIRKYAELDLDALFEKFYDKILSSKDLSGFFRDEAHIRSLIERQKAFLLDTITASDEDVRERYITLGEMHYELKVPYVDYVFGMHLLEEGLIHSIVAHGEPVALMDATFHFFKQVRAYTAKGYLNKMLKADIADIDLYLTHVQRASDIDTALAIERMIWLKNVLFAIKMENRKAAPALHMPAETIEAVKMATHGDQVLLDYALDIAGRMELDARNIFFFIETHSYEEVLPLYRDLLSIYKLSLMLTNVVTIASSNSLVKKLTKDQLTGMLTRHSLHPMLRREALLAETEQYALSLVMMDIDHFKRINDQYGHLAGDEVLARVAHAASDTIRATDFAFRLGGEEFLLVLKGASNKLAASQAEAIREEVEQLQFEFSGKPYTVTASFGVATFTAPFELSYEQMLEEADRKLYESKNNGRNCVSA
ncbi:MAG: diguanylate cyclase [Sideroxydans sp.]|nr:diguanylate cyclase [Sideroxydans sp.]